MDLNKYNRQGTYMRLLKKITDDSKKILLEFCSAFHKVVNNRGTKKQFYKYVQKFKKKKMKKMKYGHNIIRERYV